MRVELESAYSKIIFLELEIFEEANAKMDRISSKNLYILVILYMTGPCMLGRYNPFYIGSFINWQVWSKILH